MSDLQEQQQENIPANSEIFSEKKVKVLRALIGAFIAELDETEQLIFLNSDGKAITSKPELLEELGKFDLSKSDDFLVKIQNRLKSLPADKIQQLNSNLKLLSNGVTAYPLTGAAKPFYELSRKQREAVLLKWSTSSQGFSRKLFTSFSKMICGSFWSGAYHFYPAIGYPGVDPELNGPKYKNKDFPRFEFLNPPEEHEAELQFDVIVIGSGAGGSVVAAELSKTGQKVLVIEKGKYYHQSELSLDQQDSQKLFEGNGGLLSEDGSLNVAAGSTFGGGTTVNWSGSLRPQHFIREEWSRKGLPFFLSDEYSKCLNIVTARMGVTEENIIHNGSNKVLIDGCKKLGFDVETIPQNSAAYPHQCGWCCFGCRYGEKQGALMTFLRDAKDNGAKFIQNCYVEKVIINNGKAVGVSAKIDGHEFTIHAQKIIVSAGSLNSPAILIRSGLKNKNIGKNLHVHPVTFIYGVFDKEIKSYSGTLMTSLSKVVENLDGQYHGAKIEGMATHPALLSLICPWKSSLQHKTMMTQLNHIAPLTILVRDKDSGRIAVDNEGKLRVHYTISPHDAKSMVAGIIAGLKILVAAGAKRIATGQAGIEEFVTAKEDPSNDPKFLKYLEKVAKVGVAPNQTFMTTGHQMGTCQMGSSPSSSVVDSNGESWEIKNLYVADASIFPSASGVDPMVTNMSLAYSVAKGIIYKDTPKAIPRAVHTKRRTLSMRIQSRNFSL
ncbi:hypothetical protein G9A89_002923 [Geosiphon pyriformis]|nr:hypothetical protein G9A89_002923 [Geosiphon pyriformis]